MTIVYIKAGKCNSLSSYLVSHFFIFFSFMLPLKKKFYLSQIISSLNVPMGLMHLLIFYHFELIINIKKFYSYFYRFYIRKYFYLGYLLSTNNNVNNNNNNNTIIFLRN